MSGMKIGEYNLKHGLMLAPMAGVTDRAFRRICREYGAEYTISEMVSSKALCYEQRSRRTDIIKTAPLAAVMNDEIPMAVQIFGCEPETMAQAASMIESGNYKGACGECKPTAIDINMGCPVHKVVSNGEGSALMKNPQLAFEIVSAVCGAVKLPVTVKIRAGWDKNSINAVEMAQGIEKAGASLIAVHARTREQMYGPGTDWSIIREVKNAVGIPVVGNGDIKSADDALRMLDETGCDGVMVGRGAQGNPWIFGQISDALEGRRSERTPIDLIFETALRQVRLELEFKDERVAVAESKKHLAWYMHDFRASAGIRSDIMLASSYSEFEKILTEYREWLRGREEI